MSKYTFLPWMKTGFSGVISQDETSDSPDVGRPSVLVDIDLERQRTGDLNPFVDSVQKNIAVRGPGDIARINKRAIIRNHPEEGNVDFEANYLPFVEFYDEDFPWRFTPAVGYAGTIDNVDGDKFRLSPWIYLLVLKADEFELDLASVNFPKLNIKIDPEGDNLQNQTDVNDLFVPHDELWAWAHVQFNAPINDELNASHQRDFIKDAMSEDGNLAFSRLMSPRKLERDTDYHAFIIPSFKAGWLAGMEMDPSQANSLEYAWENGESVPLDHPFYHTWNFRTAADGDFETLANRIEPQSTPPEAGVRDMDIHLSGWGTKTENLEDNVLGLESALRPPTLVNNSFINTDTNEEYVQSLQDVLNANSKEGYWSGIDSLNDEVIDVVGGVVDDPLVLPPMYGQWHALKSSLDRIGNATNWFEELNLDPRNRAVAGFGTTLVKHHQEEFMEEAWEQVEDVLTANKRIAQAKLMTKVGERMFQKHIKHPKDTSQEAEDRLVRMTNVVHKSVALTTSINALEGDFKKSKVPDALRSGVFRKMTRPGGKVSRRISNNEVGSFTKNIISRSNMEDQLDRTIFFKKNVRPTDAIAMNIITEYATGAEDGIADEANVGSGADYYQTQSGVIETIVDNITPLTKSIIEKDPVVNLLVEKTHPTNAVKDRILSTIEIWDNELEKYMPIENFDQVMAHPEIDLPLYEYLKSLLEDYIIPNAERILANSATLMETNPRFMDAFFAGANHEMSRELLWREYPTDMRGTYFKYFWDRSDAAEGDEIIADIEPINEWEPGQSLGENQDNASSKIVLVIKADLLEKFPDTLVYAQAAQWSGTEIPTDLDAETPKELNEDATPSYPQFKARVAGDVIILGFDLEEKDVRGVNNAGNIINPGYYFVLRERPGQTRFGLDDIEGDTPGQINVWNEATWQHLDASNKVIKGVNTNMPLGFLAPNTGIPEAEKETAKWFKSASDMAYILYQLPVMSLIHANEMLEEIVLGGDSPSEDDTE